MKKSFRVAACSAAVVLLSFSAVWAATPEKSAPDTSKESFAVPTAPARQDPNTVLAVVDGNPIRIADIDAPEIASPRCRDERHAGELARDQLLVLLNAGGFSLSSVWRDMDRYGRKLRTVTRGEQSIGEMLVAEGLARRWNEARRDWCALD